MNSLHELTDGSHAKEEILERKGEMSNVYVLHVCTHMCLYLCAKTHNPCGLCLCVHIHIYAHMYVQIH